MFLTYPIPSCLPIDLFQHKLRFFAQRFAIAWYMLQPSVCLSARSSSVRHKPVLCQSGLTYDHKQTRHNSPGTLQFYDLDEIPMESPPTGLPNAGGVVKNCAFRPIDKSLAQTLYH